MSPSAPSSSTLKRHPWDIRFKPGEDDKLRAQLAQPIGRGLAEVGITLKHARGGKLRPVHHLYHLHAEGKPWAFRLFPYCHLRWLWRITIGFPSHNGFGLHDAKEFSLLDEEITEQTGRDLAALIRALHHGEPPVWPMFDKHPSFPRYAWSNAATERYEDWREWDRDQKAGSATRRVA